MADVTIGPMDEALKTVADELKKERDTIGGGLPDCLEEACYGG